MLVPLLKNKISLADFELAVDSRLRKKSSYSTMRREASKLDTELDKKIVGKLVPKSREDESKIAAVKASLKSLAIETTTALSRKADEVLVSKMKSDVDSLMKKAGRPDIEIQKLPGSVREMKSTIDSLVKKASQLPAEIQKLPNSVKEVKSLLKNLSVKVNQSLSGVLDNSRKLRDYEARDARDRLDMNNWAEAMSGNMVLRNDVDSESVTAAALNAAAADALSEDYTVVLSALLGTVYRDHNWAAFEPVLTPAESVADVQVGVPTVEWVDDTSVTPHFVRGTINLKVTFDTDAGATKTYQAGTKSTGSVTCIVKANLVDGETLTLEDALGVSKVFEFDVAGDGVTAGRVAVDVSGDTTAAEVASTLTDAINSTAGFAMTATLNGNDADLEQDDALAAGDTTITETVTDAGFTVTSFTGGVDRDSVTVKTQVAAADTLLGWAVAFITKTFYVV